MFARYAVEKSVTEAFVNTFSGKNPCSLCHLVDNGRKDEQKREGGKVVVKLEAVLGENCELPLPSFEPLRYLSRNLQMAARSFAPPLLPPRVA